MDLDLSQALHDAARVRTAHRPALAPAPVMHRIRRRRRVRVATESTLGVAAAGALALGTVQVLETRTVTPAPPATEAPSPTATPLPSPAAVTPTGDFGCGVPVPALLDPDGAADLHFRPTFTVPAGGAAASATVYSGSEVATLAPGQLLLVDAGLVNDSVETIDARRTHEAEVEIWFARDGVAVGQLVATAEGAGTTRQLSSVAGEPGTGWSQEQPAGVPTACGPDGVLAGELPAGDYAVYLVQDLSTAGVADVELAGGPYPASIVVPPAPPGPSPTPPEPERPDPGTSDPHPDAQDLVLSPAGLGPLTVGQPPESNPGAAMIEWDADFCAEITSESPGRWVPSGYEPEVRDGEPRPLFHVAADEAAVGRIDVLSPTIRTAEGVGVGTTLAELEATYPTLEGPFDGPLSRVWWLTGPTGTLVFETQGDADGLQPAGTPESVILMRVLAAGSDPAFATANSDDVAGGCL